MFYSPPKKIQKISLYINNKIIEQKPFAKYLGVILDKHLSWQEHISSTRSKLQRSIGIVSKLRYHVPKNILRSIYYAFVHPHITYSLINWCCATPHTLLPIDTSLKKIIRIMSFKDNETPSEPLFKNYNILNFNKLIFLILKQNSCSSLSTNKHLNVLITFLTQKAKLTAQSETLK